MTKLRFWMGAAAVTLLLLAGADAQAGSLTDTNLVNLLRDAESIVVGQVQSVTDGIDGQGVPYTEITIEVGETIRGSISGTYTFRQFGLLEPRLTADGTKKMMPAPDVFPRYKAGEEVVLFLNPAAGWTGLQTTAGLGQGKFVLGPGRVESDLANQGVFNNISVDAGIELSANENRMLATEIGAVSPDTFLSFVRRAVENRWVETAQMWRTDEGRPRSGGATRPGRPGRKGSVIGGPTSTSGSGATSLDRN